MKLSTLTKANIFITCILLLGFCLLSFIYYSSFYKNSMDNLKHSASDSISTIYSELSNFFIQPISISRTMAKNDFLITFLSNDESYKRDNFAQIITNYLNIYNKSHSFDGIFLSSIKNKSVYTQDGLIAHIEDQKEAHAWHENSLSHTRPYDLNIDFDKTPSANNNPSLFINYKIFDKNNNLLGITGICVHLESIMEFLLNFERQTRKNVYIIDDKGTIQISSSQTGLSDINLFEFSGNTTIKSLIDTLKNGWKRSKISSITDINPESQNYISIKYLPNLSWYLVIESYMGDFYQQLKDDIIKSGIIILSIMISIIIFISRVIYSFERQIKKITEDRLKYFYDATRYIYSSIYEIDITNDRFTPESRLRQFKLSNTKEELPYSQSLSMLSDNAIHPSFKKKFLETFSRENLLKNFSAGCDHISLDCQVFLDGKYQWLRYDVHMFNVDIDKSIHMYLYAKNINDQIEKENKARTDDLTQCLTRGFLEQSITQTLTEKPNGRFAFLILDIDYFKQANDTYGHAFGDLCLRSFAETIRHSFNKNDIIGRLGGDEFIAFVPYADEAWVRQKAEELVKKLAYTCVDGACSMEISGSLGIALYPADGESFDKLYRHADAALYVAKSSGRKTFHFYKDINAVSH